MTLKVVASRLNRLRDSTGKWSKSIGTKSEFNRLIFKSYELLQGVVGYQPLRTGHAQSSGFVESFLHLRDADHQLHLGLRDLMRARGVRGHGNY